MNLTMPSNPKEDHDMIIGGIGFSDCGMPAKPI